MVSERVVISLVFGSTWLLVMTGILYTKSSWYEINPQRIDLFVDLQGAMFLTAASIVYNFPQDYFPRYIVLFTSLVYFIIFCILGLAIHELMALVLWVFHCRRQVSQPNLFREYLVEFVLYSAHCLISIIASSVLAHMAITRDDNLERFREYKAFWGRVYKQYARIRHDALSRTSLQATADFLDGLGGADLPHVFKVVLFEQVVSHVMMELAEAGETCGICEFPVVIGDMVYKHLNGVRVIPQMEVVHLDCLYKSYLHLEWGYKDWLSPSKISMFVRMRA